MQKQQHVRRGTKISIQYDIFAFGCAVYEILAENFPDYELEKYPDRDQRMQELYSESSLSDVTQLPLHKLILDCWHDTFSSMEEVIKQLNTLITEN